MKETLLDELAECKRILFYPSSCKYDRAFQDLPFDAVVLNAKRLHPATRNGKVFCLSYDNNELLGAMQRRRIRLSSIVVIRDGCCEGGNYQCVLSESFFGRLMPLVGDDFEFFIDHGTCPQDVPARFSDVSTPRWLNRLIECSDPISEVRAFHAQMCHGEVAMSMLGQIPVRFMRDSLWRDLEDTDFSIIRTTGSSQRAVENYLNGLDPEATLAERIELVRDRPLRTIQKLLEKAREKKAAKLALMPIADGDYCQIAKEITQWTCEYPQRITAYHLNRGDFRRAV